MNGYGQHLPTAASGPPADAPHPRRPRQPAARRWLRRLLPSRRAVFAVLAAVLLAGAPPGGEALRRTSAGEYLTPVDAYPLEGTAPGGPARAGTAPGDPASLDREGVTGPPSPGGTLSCRSGVAGIGTPLTANAPAGGHALLRGGRLVQEDPCPSRGSADASMRLAALAGCEPVLSEVCPIGLWLGQTAAPRLYGMVVVLAPLLGCAVELCASPTTVDLVSALLLCRAAASPGRRGHRPDR